MLQGASGFLIKQGSVHSAIVMNGLLMSRPQTRGPNRHVLHLQGGQSLRHKLTHGQPTKSMVATLTGEDSFLFKKGRHCLGLQKNLIGKNGYA